MHSLAETPLNCNNSVKIDFSGGDLSSDAGLLLIQDFASKIGFTKTIRHMFHTTDTALTRRHTDDQNLMQAIYQIIASYGEDDCADELTNRVVHSARYVYFRLCSTCPYKEQFYETLHNIGQLRPALE